MYIYIYIYTLSRWKSYRGNSSHLFCWIAYRELLWYVVKQLLFEAFGKRWNNICIVAEWVAVEIQKRSNKSIVLRITTATPHTKSNKTNGWKFPYSFVQRELIQLPVIVFVVGFRIGSCCGKLSNKCVVWWFVDF